MGSDLDINSLAKKASIYLSDEDKIKMQNELQSILSFSDMLLSIHEDAQYEATDEIEESLREDIAVPFPAREELLAATKTEETGYVTVPLVIKER